MQIQVTEIRTLSARLNLFLRCVTIQVVRMDIQTSVVSTDEMTTNEEAHGGNSGATVAESNGKGFTNRRCLDGPRRMRDEFVSRSLEFHGELHSDGQIAHRLRG